jgi:prepilin-type processing-associated H-X9-DG protein
MTDYVAIVGPNTAWPRAKGSKLSDFKDPSKTILVVEVTNSGISWAEPRDLSLEVIAKGILSNHVGGFDAVFADGHVEFIPDDIDPKKLAEMFEINPLPDAAKQLKDSHPQITPIDADSKKELRALETESALICIHLGFSFVFCRFAKSVDAPRHAARSIGPWGQRSLKRPKISCWVRPEWRCGAVSEKIVSKISRFSSRI